jgi:hypothetical protein
MKWRGPWKQEDRPRAAELESELRRELAPGHPLYGVGVTAIGSRQDTDDVLFRLEDGSHRVAVVHLTWSRGCPEQPPWPATSLFESLEAWVECGMEPDHEET